MGEKEGERKERKERLEGKQGGRTKEGGRREGRFFSQLWSWKSKSKELCQAGSLSCVLTWWGGKPLKARQGKTLANLSSLSGAQFCSNIGACWEGLRSRDPFVSTLNFLSEF